MNKICLQKTTTLGTECLIPLTPVVFVEFSETIPNDGFLFSVSP